MEDAVQRCTWCGSDELGPTSAMHWHSRFSAMAAAWSCGDSCSLQIEALRDHDTGKLRPLVILRAGKIAGLSPA